MNKFNDVKAFALVSAESELLQAGRSYESFADLLSDDEYDACDELTPDCCETSRRKLDQINRELADIASTDAALAIYDDEPSDGKWLNEATESSFNNPAGSQPEIFPEEVMISGSSSVPRSHLNILQAVDAIVQFRHFEVDSLVALPQDHLP